MVNRLSPIELSLSTQTLKYKPGGRPVTFEVTVVNASGEFATMVLELKAAGADSPEDTSWYRLFPEVGTKTPPGDRTQFTVEIINNPVPGFVGNIQLTVQVLFLEQANEVERRQLTLNVEPGMETLPLEVTLPVTSFTVEPQSSLEIPVELHNPGAVPVSPTLGCEGLPPSWSVRLPSALPPIAPGKELETRLHCHLPDTHQVPSQPYPFAITAQTETSTAQATGEIYVVPQGRYIVAYEPVEQDFPAQTAESAARSDTSATPPAAAHFGIAVENASNLAQSVSVIATADTLPPDAIAVAPATTLLGIGEVASLDLQVTPSQPWWGWPRAHELTAQVHLDNDQLTVENETQILQLWVKPRIPFLLQLIGILGLVAVPLLPLLLRSEGHSQAVNQLQLSGDADRIFSGSNDQTVRRWRIDGDRLQPDGVLAALDKAVRVVELRPLSNDVLAIGFENGEISLWDVLSTGEVPLSQLVDEQANRVLDLEFSDDANTLFSSHGSGAVLQWAIGKTAAAFDDIQAPAEKTAFDFAVYALAGVGNAGQHLAVAGRYNRLVLWNWQTGDRLDLRQNQGTQNDYIQSLDTPNRRPDHLAVADNQGRIQLWDVGDCVTPGRAVAQCATLLETWENGHGGAAVRSLAYTPDGCYLVSVGDDRRVMLWPLAADGRRDPNWLNGRVVRRSRQKLNTVDAILNGQQILVSSGGDDRQVRLDSLPQSQFRQPNAGQCNAAR